MPQPPNSTDLASRRENAHERPTRQEPGRLSSPWLGRLSSPWLGRRGAGPGGYIACTGALKEQSTLARILRKRRCALELRAGFVQSPDFYQEVAARAGQEVV